MQREQFGSSFGFLMAASGSAVGLGNIWGFPTQVASNGGAAFVLVYLLLVMLLAYPAFLAELIIGRHGQANNVASLRAIKKTQIGQNLASFTGYAGVALACLIQAFYIIVAGWTLAFAIGFLAKGLGFFEFAQTLFSLSTHITLIFTTLFFLLAVWVVDGGVRDGIERWASRFMPSLLVLLVVLIIYMFTLDGAMDGLKVYLLPDFSKTIDSSLLISAMGQAFFSLSLGVGGMMIYGSYVSKKENLPKLAFSVTLIDVGIALIAGLLIIPAMYVALNNGVEIFDANGVLLSQDKLVFTVLPSLFNTLGVTGFFVAAFFFIMLFVASLTSSIALLEVPVSTVVEQTKRSRSQAGWMVAGVVLALSFVVVFNFNTLFGLLIVLTTQYGEPLIGILYCVFVGWLWNRNALLNEISQGYDTINDTWFWKIWPVYVQFVCPLLIFLMFVQSVL